MSAATRRDVLGAIASIPAIGLATLPVSASTSNASAWNRAMAAYHKSQEAVQDFQPILDARWAAYEAALPRPDMVDLDALPFPNRNDVLLTGDIDLMELQIHQSRGRLWNGEATKGRMLLALAQVREFRKLKSEAEQRYRVDEIVSRSEALEGAAWDAKRALLILPAPDLSALLWKLEYLYGDDARDAQGCGVGWSQTIVDAFMEDVRRFAKKEAQ